MSGAIQNYHPELGEGPKSKIRNSTRLVLPAILILGLGLRLAYAGGLAPGGTFASVDARGYRQLAASLLDTGHFSDPGGSALGAIRTPLYPAFLAVLLGLPGDPDRTVPLAQAVVDTATIAVVYGIGSRLAGRRRGRVAALLYSVNPVSFLLIGEALTEVLLACLLALSVLLFIIAVQAGRRRRFWLLLAGLVAGLCVLAKPNVVLLPVILAAGVVLAARRLRDAGRSWREAALLVAAALCVLAPWVIRNRVAFGQWFLSLAFDDNLAHVSAVATMAEVRAETVAPWTPRWEEIHMIAVVEPARSRYGWSDAAGAPDARLAVQRQREMAAVARDVIRQHPLQFVASHARGVARSLVPSLHRYWYAYLTGRPWPVAEALTDVLAGAVRPIRSGDWRAGLAVLGAWWSAHPAFARALWLAANALQIVAYALVAIGLWALRRRPAALIALGLTLLYLVVLPGPIAYVRFWVPAVPIACATIACFRWKVGRLSRQSSNLPSFH